MVFLLLVVDSLRADRLSCNSYTAISTPNIDRLAENGVNYKQAHSMASYTSDSLPYIINNNFLLRLRNLGFKTAIVHSTAQIDRANMKQKFDVDYYLDVGKRNHNIFNRVKNLVTYVLWGNYWKNEKAEELHREAHKIITNCQNPLFMIIWYIDVHQPYHPKNIPFKERIKSVLLGIKMFEGIHTRDYSNITKEDLRNLVKLYDQQIIELDHDIGNFIKELNNPFVAFTADHGEEFLENGRLSHHGFNTPELRHVPLIISSPNIKPQVIEETTTLDQLHNLILRNIGNHLLYPQLRTPIPTRIKEEANAT